MPTKVDPADIVGRRFGRLDVLQYLHREPYKGRYHYVYECRCDCGTVRELFRSNIITGHTRSCGCRKATRPTGPNSPHWTGHGKISGRLWGHIKAHARTRKLPVTITIEDAWALFQAQDGKCALTGFDLCLRTPKGNGSNAVSASLDRIDNSKGYVPGNIQWVHKDINWMKGRFNPGRFLTLCRAVAAHCEK